jgi:hypothetical protein
MRGGNFNFRPPEKIHYFVIKHEALDLWPQSLFGVRSLETPFDDLQNFVDRFALAPERRLALRLEPLLFFLSVRYQFQFTVNSLQ